MSSLSKIANRNRRPKSPTSQRGSQAVPRRSLKDEAYDRVKTMILEGELSAGDFLSERTLGRELGISASPVRSALERLGVEGFVTISPQRGTIVRGVSLQEVADQFEFRSVIESHVASTLAGNLTSTQVRLLKSQLARHKRAAQRKSPNILLNVTLDMDFHLLLCQFHGNEQFNRSMIRLGDQIQRVILHVFGSRETRLEPNQIEHTAIARAIMDGNADQAAELMKSHLEFGRDFILSGDHVGWP